MTTVNALTKFGMNHGLEELTEQYALALPDCPDGQLQIDFSHCIIDYPATSRIVDAALDRLALAQPPRELVLLFNIKFREQMFLKAFFFGSRRLGLDTGIPTMEDIRVRANQALKDMNIVVHIRIPQRNSAAILQDFVYGQ